MENLTEEQAALLRSNQLRLLEEEHSITLNVIKACPEDKLSYSPNPKNRTFSQLAAHIYTAGIFFCNAAEEFENPKAEEPEQIDNLNQLLDYCNAKNDEFCERYLNFSDQELNKEIEFYHLGKFKKVHLMGWHLRHLIHHRAQLQMYFRLMDLKVPAIYGSTADEKY